MSEQDRRGNVASEQRNCHHSAEQPGSKSQPAAKPAFPPADITALLGRDVQAISCSVDGDCAIDRPEGS